RAGEAPAYCIGAGALRRMKKKRTRRMPPTTTNAISRKLANVSDRPKCDRSAARPMPGARPAIGPSQRDMPDGAAAGVAGVAVRGAADGAAGLFGVLGVALGVLGAGVIWRCEPQLRPPPRRLAAATSAASPA